MADMRDTSITVYGIRNCDTVKKARQWLTDRQIAYEFHDFKLQGVPIPQLDQWLASLPWETLLNRQGNTWRKLDDATKAATVDAASARAIMLAHPSAIKRPVVEWNGSASADVTVGFKSETWSARVAPSSTGGVLKSR